MGIGCQGWGSGEELEGVVSEVEGGAWAESSYSAYCREFLWKIEAWFL